MPMSPSLLSPKHSYTSWKVALLENLRVLEVCGPRLEVDRQVDFTIRRRLGDEHMAIGVREGGGLQVGVDEDRSSIDIVGHDCASVGFEFTEVQSDGADVGGVVLPATVSQLSNSSSGSTGRTAGL